MSEDTPWQRNHLEGNASMIKHQLLRRGIRDSLVLKAMRATPRHLFIPIDMRQHAYADRAVDIGEGQTISQPYIVAFILEQLQLKSTDKILEIGTGSGYQAAVAALIAGFVYSVEINARLAFSAKSTLEELRYHNISVRRGNGHEGWEEHSPYDAIMVSAGAEDIPEKLVNQLKPGGRMILPLGPHHSVRQLVLIRNREGNMETNVLLPVRFVPLKKY